ncbi:glycoside hydrolase domain-containing protein [Desemzia sp. FAM 24101]|uniref:glycoside hydrolase domain-containing protein n=1 Tax=unclassified Desemzia TaxID=2685243 RepID=UPI0038866A21
MADEMVKKAQEWVNGEYGEHPGYQEITANGNTGWSTMYALTRALQIELGITATSNSFGETTLAEFTQQYGTIGQGQNDSNSNIVKIIQSALYSKGYGPGGITGTYGLGTAAAVLEMKTDMGLSGTDGTVTPKIFKALLTMDAYIRIGSGTTKVRTIQQWLNNRYQNRRDFYLQPTDGIYQRGTQKALIYALQYEEGLSDDVANGNFGPTTKAKLPTLQNGNRDGTTQFVHLLQAALCFNNFEVDFDGSFGPGTKEKVVAFQTFSALQNNGIVGIQTWSSLLVSTGDPSRKGTALDCVMEVTPARAQTLVNAGYETVGRYLTNVEGTTLNKKIQPGELETIFNAGLTVFPIYQTYGGAASYFNEDQGTLDAIAAHNAAKGYGFSDGTIIYFAVDYDSTDDEITNSILPHFESVYSKITELGSYKVGIYGTRNACSRVSNAGYAVTSFVSGMSTGFSGNLGFPLPSNWAFDQISTITLGSGDGQIEMDNNIKSGRDNGASKVIRTDEYIIEQALKSTVKGIFPFSEIFNYSVELDGKTHVINDNLYYRLEYKASREIEFGEGNPMNTIAISSDGTPMMTTSLLNAIASGESIANDLELDLDTGSLIYSFGSNIGGTGFISTYISISSKLEVEYNYEITKPVTLLSGVIIAPKIIFTLVLKNTSNPNNPNLVPVETVEPYTVPQLTTTEKVAIGTTVVLIALAAIGASVVSGGAGAPAAFSAAGLVITTMLSSNN